MDENDNKRAVDELLEMGNECEINKDYGGAIQHYEEALDLNPYNPKIYQVLGSTYLRAKNTGRALLFYKKAIEINPKCSHILYSDVGWCALHDNDIDTALKYFKEATKINPAFYECYSDMGNIYLTIKDYNKAIICYDEALNFNGDLNSDLDLYSIYLSKGKSLVGLKRYDEAIICYNKAISEDSGLCNYTCTGAYLALGEVFGLKGNLDEAIKYYDYVISDYEEDEWVYQEKGSLLERLGEYNKAIECYKEGIKKCLIVQSLWLDICRVHYLKKEYDKSFEVLNNLKKLKSSEESSSLRNYWIGKLYLKKVGLGNTVKSSETYSIKKAVESFKLAFENNSSSDYFRNDEFFIIYEYLKTNVKSEDREVLIKILENIYPILDYVNAFKKTLVSTSILNGSNLVHYTNPEAVKALIMPESYFRLSNIKYMNDPEEGKTLLKRIQENKIEGINVDYPLRYFYGLNEGIDFQTTFVGSFLEEEDNLYLWRTYGKDNANEEANGMSIVLKNEYFEKIPNNNFYSLKHHFKKEVHKQDDLWDIIWGAEKYFDNRFSPVIYDVLYLDTNGSNKIKQLLQEIYAYLNELKNMASKNAEYTGIISTVVRSVLDEILFLIKSEHYREEKENRILITCGIDDSRIKEDSKTDYPHKLYIEIEKPFREYIAKIVLGPRVEDTDKWKLYLNRKKICVKESECNYR
ncbi:tetratricopeptide repeat protein [Methanococcus maripaludis]|uniref:Tetratricopeptide (TPR) repeat protein n=1 Tax=Methanococcus maripaludis TaxID=39152 RepID=A0A7J9S2I6_METMI|nr:tetratricopeptide repeat protein [Methanococcus maripaludis]MBB6067910.1 tetratricopeptide (TPR) repeat protein [Methanococcus maripaludis]